MAYDHMFVCLFVCLFVCSRTPEAEGRIPTICNIGSARVCPFSKNDTFCKKKKYIALALPGIYTTWHIYLHVCLFVCLFTDSGSCRSVALPRMEPTLPGGKSRCARTPRRHTVALCASHGPPQARPPPRQCPLKGRQPRSFSCARYRPLPW